ncbi:CNTN3 [Cordylochernes scorpioides]|uniref:CNTN3 n=1 Tax=Cordylochernes scorpioides TaxID=51811 RepID=A0ABY6KGY6_9ARAC|nr:CNTN3 [Cordylochernes scorpioides]
MVGSRDTTTTRDISAAGGAVAQTCPTGWVEFQDECLKFIRSPQRNYLEAQDKCRAYNAELVSVASYEKLQFVTTWLRENDPQHRRWYTSGRDDGENIWTWDSMGSHFSNIENLWLPSHQQGYGSNAAFKALSQPSMWCSSFSEDNTRWGLQKVSPMDQMSFICEISKEKLHQIVLLERSLDYGLKITDPEKLPRGPTFIKDAQDVVFNSNERSQVNYISLRCEADGYPTPTYKWYKEEYVHDSTVSYLIDPLSDDRYTQTDGILTIFDPQNKKDRGKYHCQATNNLGTVISRTAQLSFGTIGEFNRIRSPDVGNENWGKSISCDPPQHYPRVIYYWSRNQFPVFVEEDQRVFVSYDGSLYFSALEKTDRANYSCNVQSVISSTGRTGPFFPLQVDPACKCSVDHLGPVPSLSTNGEVRRFTPPFNLNYKCLTSQDGVAASGQKLMFPNNFPKSFPDAPLAGQEVILECVAYGYPVPYYNWTRAGGNKQLPIGSYTKNYDRVLVLPKIRVEDQGAYLCTANNGHETIQKSVTLSIQAAPEFTIPLGHRVADRGSTLSWSCEAFGIPDVHYRWLRNGQELVIPRLSPEFRVRYRILDNLLVIEDVQEMDEGMFQCEAINQLGSAYSAGQLRVITLKPTFSKYPMDEEMYAAEGGNYTIPCRPEAAPFPAEFKWRKDGSPVHQGGRIRVLNNGYLYLQQIRHEDKGLYTCEATNPYGTDRTEGMLIVLAKPKLVEQLQPKIVAAVNDSVEMRCKSYAGELLDVAYLWYHNELPINMGANPRYSLGSYPGYLRIVNITQSEAGNYQCVTKTHIGRIGDKTELLVIGPPGAPGAVLVEDLTSTSARIHWSDGSDNGRHILAYTVEGCTNHNSTWRVLVANISQWRPHPHVMGRKEIYLDNVLSPWSTYNFRVSAINTLGRGEPSDPSPQYNTDVDRPFTFPENVGGGGGKIGSLTITWKTLPPEEWNAEEIWYKVYFKPTHTKMDYHEKELKVRGNVGHFVEFVGDENYYLQYTVRVQAINRIAPGPISPPVVIYSAENLPQIQPSGVYAIPHNSTALLVSWSPLELTREKIRGELIGHRIKYWRNGKEPQADSLILLRRGAEPHSLIVGLQPNTEYFVAVMAYNSAGSGVESMPYLARTFKSAPQRAPTSVQVKALSPTSVLVSWRGVLTTSDEEPIVGYKVRYWEQDQDMTTAKEVLRQLDRGDLQAVVTGLTPGKAYHLRVLSYSLGGDGKMSSPAWSFSLSTWSVCWDWFPL